MLFSATLEQMAFLFSLILVGYLLVKCKAVKPHSEGVLSKLESAVFMPALVLGTFVENFTVEKLQTSWRLILASAAVLAVAIPVALVCVCLCTKDRYTKNIYWYGMCFANYGFMGNAVVQALFPEMFLEYIVFQIPIYIMTYLWGIPALLMDTDHGPHNMFAHLKNLLNPMFICMILGMVIGVLGIRLPRFATLALDSAAACMSPVAMILTGMAAAQIDLKKVLKNGSIYYITALRLVVFPLAFLLVTHLAGGAFGKTFVVCAMVSITMPLGMNTVVIPSAYGKDTTLASGMVIVSHVLGCLTIPLVFGLMEKLIG